MYTLAELFPDSLYYRYQKCSFMGYLEGYSPTTVQCYAPLLPLFAKKASPEQLEREPEYIIVALLAESPDAGKLRENYLRNPGDDPYAWYYKQLLEHFDRKNFAEGKMPPIAWSENAPHR